MSALRPCEGHAVRDAYNGRAPMPLDRFVRAIKGKARSFILDTGFDPAMGAKGGRQVRPFPADPKET